MTCRLMKHEQALALLCGYREDIQRRFDAKHVALFGSTVRDEARRDSDVDVRVDFETVSPFDGYMGLLSDLEQPFGKKRIRVTGSGLKPRARFWVEKDLIRIR